jgi:hypothetical protein
MVLPTRNTGKRYAQHIDPQLRASNKWKAMGIARLITTLVSLPCPRVIDRTG